MLEKEKKKDFLSESSDGRYRTLFEQVNAAVFLTDLEGEIIEANWRSCELLGYSWEELSDISLQNIFPSDVEWEPLMEEISSKGGLNFESRNVRKDGSTLPVDVSVSLFTVNNKPVMLTLIRDITDRKKAEKKLKASEERYRSIFENSAVAITISDEQERIIDWNEYTEKMLGKTEEELYKTPVKELYPSDEWMKIRDEKIREKGMQHHLETKMIKKNGDLLDVDLSVSVIKDSENSPVGSIGVIRDISDRKKAERKLKESEEKYRSLFESTVDGTFVLDSRGEIVDINSRALEMFGLDKEEVTGENFLSMDLLTPKSLPIVVKQFGDLLSDKEAKTQETEIQNKNGNILNVEISSFFLVTRQDNEVDNFVVVVRDISDRKEAEIKLAKEHSLLQTLLDNVPDSIYFKDEQNRFILVNKAKARHHDVEPEDMIGKTDFDFMPEDEARRSFEDDNKVLNTGKFIIDKVEKITRKDGSKHWVSVTKVPRFDEDGNIIGTAGISRDVTRWIKIEQKLSEMNDSKIEIT
ncbi:MAG: PAS domain S-box protein [Candidatus Thermoplasmatota archaeon]